MSRHKSPERIQLDRDRTIRRERREQKKQERQERRQRRIEKRRIRELVKANGVPKIKAEPERFSIQDAISYDPCAGCLRLVGDPEIVQRSCHGCCYGENRKEVIDRIGQESETQGDTPGAEPLTATAKCPEVPPSGQLRLEM